MKKYSNKTGRLYQSLDPIAQGIVAPRKDKISLVKELTLLATLNEAHLISLFKSKLLPLKTTRKILTLIANLRKNNFLELTSKPINRGSYLSFEYYLIEKLGMEIAGSLHIGRSRNDINAITFKLNLRYFYKTIFRNICKLRNTLLQQAKKYQNLAMPIYSQYQVAQVGTYAFYLLGIEESLSRDQYFLKELFYSLDESPGGAASGCGTSFPIDKNLIASLLGFTRSCPNALDAVASRDLGLRMISTLTVLGTTLSRMAQDFQLWTTQEFSFFELPDNLCGSSSMMPQKKNPYLFEFIKGKSASLNGLLVQSLTAMHNVPFANSVEVGTHAFSDLEIALTTVSNTLVLSELLVNKAIPYEPQFIKSIQKGMAVATSVAEFLVKEKKIPFRQAHFEIGALISKAISKKEDPRYEVFKLADNKHRGMREITLAYLNEYGGGPGKNTTKKSIQQAHKRLLKDSSWITSIEKLWKTATDKLHANINNILKTKGNSK